MISRRFARICQPILFVTLLAIGPRHHLAAQEAVEDRHYIVQRGDTLFRIASLYGTTVEAFAEFNDINNPSLIFVGQQLRVPPSPVQAVAPPLPSFAEAIVNGGEGAVLVHHVARGETLSQIAAEFGMPLSDLVEQNEIENASLLHVNQPIEIPGLNPVFIDAPWPEPVTGLQSGPAILREGQSGRLLLQTSRPARIRGRFLGQDLHFIADWSDRTHIALFGVPINVESGYRALTIDVEHEDNTASFQWPLEIQEGVFGREAIFLPAEDLDTLEPETEQVEHDLLEHIVSGFRPGRWFDGLMIRPSVGAIVSRFGSLRSYNNSPYDRVHAGVDYAAPTGANVQAVADGVVVLASDLNVRGLSIIIDHGLGVFSGYWHLSKMDVAIGDFVRSGDGIGEVGNSGRSTGSHLHWQLWVNGVAVDPLQWLHTDFTSLGEDQE